MTSRRRLKTTWERRMTRRPEWKFSAYRKEITDQNPSCQRSDEWRAQPTKALQRHWRAACRLQPRLTKKLAADAGTNLMHTCILCEPKVRHTTSHSFSSSSFPLLLFLSHLLFITKLFEMGTGHNTKNAIDDRKQARQSYYEPQQHQMVIQLLNTW